MKRWLIVSVTLLSSLAFAEKKEVEFKNSGGCFKIFIDEPAADILTCKQQPKIDYKILDCASRKVLENASVEAHIHCEDSNHFKLEFRTSKGAVTALLDVRRESKGRKGNVVSYVAHETSYSDKDPHSDH